jgi:hypothetical protein
MACCTARNEFRFLTSTLLPADDADDDHDELGLLGFNDRFTSSRSEPSSMLQSETPRNRHIAWSSLENSTACPASRISGFDTTSSNATPARLKSSSAYSESTMFLDVSAVSPVV